ncbi:MAG TPA: SAM-dependent methyltransferase [Steroidobacteraceae bacterium]|jgi:SAM-dependent MidA family methyltransferase|nr:SAM-dependent methyltransferase [Steroidobacteraceae bacterium]
MTAADAAVEHSARTRAHLLRQIDAAGGFLSFEQFMDQALYAPGLGYYCGGAQKLGAGGDFTTAPEVSGLFGACVALQCAEILRGLPRGGLPLGTLPRGALPRASIVEIGAGSGRLAADILARLESLDQLPGHYSILEISADLRARQREHIGKRLPHLLHRVQWLDGPPEEAFDGIILANEVLDALPVARFRWRQSSVEEMGVGIKDGSLAWSTRPADAAMTRVCRELAAAGGGWDEGYTSEYCPRLAAWTEAVTRKLRTGAVLWFDYGLPRSQYYLAERCDGTLLCHFRHRVSDDPFANLGLQDITAWVDFTALALASQQAGLEVAGFTTQAHFLAGLQVDQEMRRAAGGDENLFARLANQARQLMLPGEMGERFKAMACLRGMDRALSGFALLDLRHTL